MCQTLNSLVELCFLDDNPGRGVMYLLDDGP
jgi:hypothetical protein